MGSSAKSPRKYFLTLLAFASLSILLVTRHLLLPNGHDDGLRRLSSGLPNTTVEDVVPLRIMCLGASVVKGETSEGVVGFRQELRKNLVASGHLVNMVGLEKVGDMKDNDVEARGGNRLGEVHRWALESVPKMKPNLFILNVGSNDCLQKFDIPNYHTRLEGFVTYLFDTSPRGTVLLSTLLTNTVKEVEDMEQCIWDVNSQIRDVFQHFKSQGKSIALAEMHDKFIPEGDTLERPHTSNIVPDGTYVYLVFDSACFKNTSLQKSF